jgi:hypothetical protein
MYISKTLGLIGLTYIISLISLIYLSYDFSLKELLESLGFQYTVYFKTMSYLLAIILFILASMPSLILFWMYEISNKVNSTYLIDSEEYDRE